jgi:hypothetical protein
MSIFSIVNESTCMISHSFIYCGYYSTGFFSLLLRYKARQWHQISLVCKTPHPYLCNHPTGTVPAPSAGRIYPKLDRTPLCPQFSVKQFLKYFR